MKIGENSCLYRSNIVLNKSRNIRREGRDVSRRVILYSNILSLSLSLCVTRTKKSVSNYRLVSRGGSSPRKLTITAGRRMDHDRITPISSPPSLKVVALVIGSAIDCRDASGSIEIGLKSHYSPIPGKHDNPVTWAFISKDFPISPRYIGEQ